MVFIVSFALSNNIDAGVAVDDIYLMKKISKYDSYIEEMENITEDLKKEIETQKQEIKKLQIDDYEKKVQEYTLLTKKLEYHNGFTDINGPGIMIRLSDSTIEDDSLDIMQKIVHDVDVTVLINDLKSAGAEAIDVNGKRIVNISEIVCAGPILKINKEAVPAPFIIRAIGNQQELYNSVTAEGTYAFDLKSKYGMEVSVLRSYNLVIPRYYTKNFELKYTIGID